MILTILTMLISMGYSALNQNLSVSGEAFLRVKENIRISEVDVNIEGNDGYALSFPEYSKKATKLYSTLQNEGSYVIYIVEITNTTGARYKFDSLTVSNTNSNVKCTPSVSSGSIIETGVSNFTVEVKYDEGITLSEDIQDVCEINYEFVPLDLVPPTLTTKLISQQDKTAKIKITAEDEEDGSGLSPDNIYKYCISTSSEEANECVWTNYINGEEFEITADSVGEYYLFVYSVGDNAGNVSDGKESIGKAVNKLYLPLFDKEKNFAYTGSEQTYIVPVSGYYTIEAWGAQGGSSILDGGTRDVSSKTTCVLDGTGKCAGGNGAYTQGIIYLNKNETLYVYVGGKGATGVASGTAQGGYNGGGSGDYDHSDDEANGAGGGATDIRLVGGTWNNDTSLNSRIMVAAGGSGASDTWSGLPGGDLRSSDTNAVGSTKTDIKYATQTEGYKFGIGQDGVYVRKNYPLSGAGGGYYGGFSVDDGSTFDNRGSGGSSFISGFAGVNAITSASSRTHTANTIHYSGKYFINSTMELGANTGNGKVSITYLSKTEPERKNTRLNNVRYIKDCVNGSDVNYYNHWVEVQAIYQGKNVAIGKTVTTTSSVNSSGAGSTAAIVDGDLTYSNYASFAKSKQCMTLDLGDTYDLDEIAIWHYWYNNRMYFENETSVSNDNSNWVTVTIPTSEETSKGRRINAYESYTQPLKLSLNLDGGKYVSQEETVIYYVSSGKSIDLLTPTKTGYVFSGWEVSGQGSKISGTNFTMGSEDTTLTAVWVKGTPSYTYTGKSQLINDGDGNWRIKFLTSGTLTFTDLGTGVNGIDVFLVGGGGGGRTGSQSVNGAGGGGGGYTTTKKGHTVSAGSSYNIVIGAGGATNSNGGTSSAFGFSAAGGKYGSPGSSNFGVEVAIGGNGGSGGGGGTSYQGYGGNGGSNGSNGSNGTGGNGGTGQGTTTREFGESDGTLYAGGGAGTEGKAGSGGGGAYNNTNDSAQYSVANGTANTGGGGGGGAYNFIKGGTGGSGIVVIRNSRDITKKLPTYTYTGKSTLESDKNGNWKIKFLSSGTLTFTSLGDGTTTVDLFLVGGGGSGRYAGGGGGYTRTVKSLTVSLNTSQKIVVGKGAAFSFTETINGGSSSALGYTAAGGYGVGQADKGGNGGSGGGGYAYSDSNSWAGSGGSNGGNGDASSSGCSGGYGQISVPGPNGETGNTREFGESTGDLYSGGGAGTAASGSAGTPGEVTTINNSGRGGGGVAGEDGIVIIRKHK